MGDCGCGCGCGWFWCCQCLLNWERKRRQGEGRLTKTNQNQNLRILNRLSLGLKVYAELRMEKKQRERKRERERERNGLPLATSYANQMQNQKMGKEGKLILEMQADWLTDWGEAARLMAVMKGGIIWEFGWLIMKREAESIEERKRGRWAEMETRLRLRRKCIRTDGRTGRMSGCGRRAALPSLIQPHATSLRAAGGACCLRSRNRH